MQTDIWVQFDLILMVMMMFTMTSYCFAVGIELKRKGFQNYTRAFLYLILVSMAHVLFNGIADLSTLYSWDYRVQLFCYIGYNLMGYLICHAFTLFFIYSVSGSASFQKYAVAYDNILTALNVVVTLAYLPTGRIYTVQPDGTYVRGDLFFFSYMFVFLGMFFNFLAVLLLVKERKQKIAFIIYLFLPLVGAAATLFLPSKVSYNDIAITLSMTVLFSVILVEREEEQYRNEAEYANYRINTMLSQIQPHFLYNTLSSISCLCTVDPERASNLTCNLATYLRGNLDALNSNNLVLLQKEIDHTKIYTEIEKVRFGSRLSVTWNITDTDFKLPVLTIQPIVENAIKHGICAKLEGGNVHIDVHRDGIDHIVTVTDTGVGFNPSQVPDDGKTHYGINLVRDRIKIMCDGSLDILSTPGIGTVVTVRIPG